MKPISFFLLAVAAWAQELQFEVASVKPNQSLQERSSIQNEQGRFRATNTSLAKLIQYALPAQNFQVVEGPRWIRNARFDIVASFAQTDRDLQNGAERGARIRARLLRLLEERFQLELREERREVPVYALTAEKSGVRMKSAAKVLGNVDRGSGAEGSTLRGVGMTMQRLADILSGIVQRPVLDESGLEGAYDLELEYSLELDDVEAGSPAKDPSYPSLFTALKEQLGLRLAGKRGIAPVWVVVRAEKPSEN